MWAFCQECSRWFYCAAGGETAVPDPTCPVCGSEPHRIVNRAAGSPPETVEDTG